jgi:hypothetical protein
MQRTQISKSQIATKKAETQKNKRETKAEKK